MIISDLMHCQTVTASSDSNLLGAGSYKKTVIKNKVVQKVDAYAVAVNFGKYGEAYAYNETSQSVKIYN